MYRMVCHLPFTCISEKFTFELNSNLKVLFRMKTENLQCWSPYLIFLDQRLWTTWTMLKKTGAWSLTVRAAPCVQWGQGQWHTLPGVLDYHSKGMEMNRKDKQHSSVIRLKIYLWIIIIMYLVHSIFTVSRVLRQDCGPLKLMMWEWLSTCSYTCSSTLK